MNQNKKIVPNLVRISVSLSIVALVLPLLGVIGWVYGISSLKQVHTVLPAMQPNTAAGLVLAAIAILIHCSKWHILKRVKVDALLASLVLAMGLLTISEYIWGIDLTIDRLFIDDIPTAIQPYPGRPSPQTSINFALLGLSLLAFRRPKLIQLSQILLIAVAANAVTALTGYIFSTENFYGFPPIVPAIGMAIHTAVTFVLLAFAALLGYSVDRGLMTVLASNTQTGAMTRKIIVALIAMPPSVGLLTKIGLVAGWYNTTFHFSIFTIIVIALALYVTWLTAQRSYQEELNARESLAKASAAEKKYSSIISVSPDAIISVNATEEIVEFNQGAEKIFGYPKSEIVGKPLDLLIPGRFRSIHHAHIKSFSCGGLSSMQLGERASDIFGLRKNGQEFPADASLSKIKINDQKKFTVSLRDITQQKRREKDYQFLSEVGPVLASSLDYQTTLENIAILAVRDFSDFCIVDIVEENEQVQRHSVVSRDALHKPICELLKATPLDRKRPHLVFEALDKRHPFFIEHVTDGVLERLIQSEDHRRSLLELKPKSILGVPLMLRDRLLGVITFISITPSRTYGEVDLQLAHELAFRAALSIENSRLYALSKQAIQTREDVLAVVSHDLKNPLYAIENANDLLLESPDLDEQKKLEITNTIRTSTRFMSKLVDDLLDFARIQSNSFAVNKAPCEFEDIRKQVAHLLIDRAQAKNINLRFQIPEKLPMLECEPSASFKFFQISLGTL